MKLNQNEIRIFYRFDSKVDEKLDLHIINSLEKYGYKYWALGSNFINNVRELVFEKIK